jgi:hypothetical protein
VGYKFQHGVWCENVLFDFHVVKAILGNTLFICLNPYDSIVIISFVFLGLSDSVLLLKNVSASGYLVLNYIPCV